MPKLNIEKIHVLSQIANQRAQSEFKLGWAIRQDLLPQFAKKVDRHRSKQFRELEKLKTLKASVHLEGPRKGSFIEEEIGIDHRTGLKIFKKVYTPEAQAEIDEKQQEIEDSLIDHEYDIRPCYLQDDELPDNLTAIEKEWFLGIFIKPQQNEKTIYDRAQGEEGGWRKPDEKEEKLEEKLEEENLIDTAPTDELSERDQKEDGTTV